MRRLRTINNIVVKIIKLFLNSIIFCNKCLFTHFNIITLTNILNKIKIYLSMYIIIHSY